MNRGFADLSLNHLGTVPRKRGKGIRRGETVKHDWGRGSRGLDIRAGRSFDFAPLPGAGIAQLVEQRIRNAQVIGSSPITSSIFPSLNIQTENQIRSTS